MILVIHSSNAPQYSAATRVYDSLRRAYEQRGALIGGTSMHFLAVNDSLDLTNGMIALSNEHRLSEIEQVVFTEAHPQGLFNFMAALGSLPGGSEVTETLIKTAFVNGSLRVDDMATHLARSNLLYEEAALSSFDHLLVFGDDLLSHLHRSYSFPATRLHKASLDLLVSYDDAPKMSGHVLNIQNLHVFWPHSCTVVDHYDQFISLIDGLRKIALDGHAEAESVAKGHEADPEAPEPFSFEVHVHTPGNVDPEKLLRPKVDDKALVQVHLYPNYTTFLNSLSAAAMFPSENLVVSLGTAEGISVGVLDAVNMGANVVSVLRNVDDQPRTAYDRHLSTNYAHLDGVAEVLAVDQLLPLNRRTSAMLNQGLPSTDAYATVAQAFLNKFEAQVLRRSDKDDTFKPWHVRGNTLDLIESFLLK